MSVKRRIAVAALTLSAAGFGAWKTHESYVPAPMIPPRGHVPTIGYGSTHYDDRRPVRMRDAPIPRQRPELRPRNLLSLDQMHFPASPPGLTDLTDRRPSVRDNRWQAELTQGAPNH